MIRNLDIDQHLANAYVALLAAQEALLSADFDNMDESMWVSHLEGNIQRMVDRLDEMRIDVATRNLLLSDRFGIVD